MLLPVPGESCHLLQNHAATQCSGILRRLGARRTSIAPPNAGGDIDQRATEELAVNRPEPRIPSDGLTSDSAIMCESTSIAGDIGVSRYQSSRLTRRAPASRNSSYIDEFVSLNSIFSTPRTTLTFFILGSDLFKILRRSTRDATACLSMAMTRSPFRKPRSSARLPTATLLTSRPGTSGRPTARRIFVEARESSSVMPRYS